MKVCLLILMVLLTGLVGCRSAVPGQVLAMKKTDALVQMRFEGNQSVASEVLRELALKECFAYGVRRPSKAVIDDVAYALQLFYLKRGHRSASVEFQLDAEASALALDQAAGPVGVRFVIDEGSVTRLQAVTFLGQPSLHGEELRSFFGAEGQHGPFVLSQVKSGLRRLREYYLESGFRAVQVELAEIRFDEPLARAYLSVRIDEGPCYRLTQVSYGEYTPELVGAQEIERDLLEEPYTPRLGFLLRSRLLDAFGIAGYPRCEISWESEVNESTGEVQLRFQIEPGELVHLSAVTLSGNEHTRGSVVRSRMPLRAGELFNSAKLQRGLRELYASGLFKSIRHDLGDDDALHLDFVENPSLELRVEPGWGSYEGPRLNVSLDERNFLGSARRVSLAAHVSPLASGSTLSFFEPRIFGTKTDASLSLFGEQREEPAYSIEHVGFNFVLRRQLHRHIESSLGYKFRVNELSEVDLVLQAPEDADEPDAGIVALNLSYNDRDDLLLPTRGTQGRLQLELAEKAFGSEIDFFRSQAAWSYIWRLGARDGIAFSTRATLIHTLDAQGTLPLFERAYLGGENSVRSFGEQDLGPRDISGQPRGGEASTFLSMEWRRRLAGNFGGALFFDAGNVVPAVEDFLHFDEFRFGVGVGLRYALPIGPLRVDVGYNPAARDEEDDFAVHFSVGYSY